MFRTEQRFVLRGKDCDKSFPWNKNFFRLLIKICGWRLASFSAEQSFVPHGIFIFMLFSARNKTLFRRKKHFSARKIQADLFSVRKMKKTAILNIFRGLLGAGLRNSKTFIVAPSSWRRRKTEENRVFWSSTKSSSFARSNIKSTSALR